MDIKVTDKKNGVKAVLSGFDTKKVEEKIATCKNGTCECAQEPGFKEKIKSIDLNVVDGVATINVTGDVDSSVIAPMMEKSFSGEEFKKKSCCGSEKDSKKEESCCVSKPADGTPTMCTKVKAFFAGFCSNLFGKKTDNKKENCYTKNGCCSKK